MDSGYEALRTSSAWMDFSSRGKVRLVGEDAARLLHAMTTQNIKDLPPDSGVYAFFLTDRGRIMADANIFRIGNDYWIDSEASSGPIIYHHLDRYIIADDATATDETALWFELGIEGPDSPSAMDQLGFPVPEQALSIAAIDGGYVARIALTGPVGFRIWVSEDHRLKLDNALASSGLPQATEEDIRAVRLEHQLPRFGEDITERYLVQETRADHAVSPNKGCYLGQEIVERVRSQGQVHRFLTPLRIAGTTAPPPGSKLVFNDAPAGEITSAAYSPALNEVVAFGYLRSEVLNKQAQMLISGMDPAIKVNIANASSRETHEAANR